MLDRLGVQMADRLVEVPGSEPVRQQLLADTLGFYRQFIAQAAGDPKLQHELALAHFKSGVIEAKLGNTAQAVTEYTGAQSLLEELAATDPTNDQLLSQLALDAQQPRHPRRRPPRQRRSPLALRAGDRDIQRRLVAEHPDEPTYAAQLAESQSNLGMLLDAEGDPAAGRGRARRSGRDYLRPLVAATDADPRYARNLSIAANNLELRARQARPGRGRTSVARSGRDSRATLRRRSQRRIVTRTTWPCATTTWPRS